ncbi:MAG: hypothetical protein DSZ30_01425 [Aquificaceae bacterium]|nr:MAG: hypothetical protein DSZ30_01425 [Aquificaceae bacterium]
MGSSLQKGFTIMELLVAIVIISILVFMISFSIYEDYVEKSKVAKDGLMYAKSCLNDLLTYCMEHPGESLDYTIFENCQDRPSFYGNVTFTIPPANCSVGGTLPENFYVEAHSTLSNKFYVKCVYNEGGIKCYTESQ